jgi:pre-60S factor REI1
VDPRQSLFDGRVSASPAANLSRMQSKYSFFIHDSEYLIDLEDFLGYCNKKVPWGNTCLYCHWTLASTEGLKHMHNKRHCKILYKRGMDMEESKVIQLWEGGRHGR